MQLFLPTLYVLGAIALIMIPVGGVIFLMRKQLFPQRGFARPVRKTAKLMTNNTRPIVVFFHEGLAGRYMCEEFDLAADARKDLAFYTCDLTDAKNDAHLHNVYFTAGCTNTVIVFFLGKEVKRINRHMDEQEILDWVDEAIGFI